MIMEPRTRGVLLLAAVFLLGGALGFALGRKADGATRAMAAANPMEPHVFVQRLGRELDLDSVQRASIFRTLTRRQKVIDSAWGALQPSVRATIDSAQTEIAAVLRPAQRTRYLQLLRAAHGGMERR